MEIEIRIDHVKYFIKVSGVVDENGNLKFNSELKNTTISTFNHRQNYYGNTIDESVSLIVKELVRALKELMEY